MRALVCWSSIFWVACGVAERNPRAEPSGGAAGSGARAGADTGSLAGTAGTQGTLGGASQGGGPGAGGGATTAGGVAGSSASGNAGAPGGSGGLATGGSPLGGSSTGGTAGTAGTLGGGSGGDGGDPGTSTECRGTYQACGCGCCSNVTPVERCYYPELPGHFDDIVAQDEDIAASPDCENAGCARPVQYVCCPSPEEFDPGATYEVRPIIGALDRVMIRRQGSDGRCAELTLVNPSAVRNEFVIETPSGWAVESAAIGGCAMSSLRGAIGGYGRVSWHGTPCVIDFDVTLFFSAEPDAPTAVRFKADGLPLMVFGPLQCQ